jgi:tetratricopeptide (TPR) repeat protein
MKELMDIMGSLDEIQMKGNQLFKDGRLAEAIQAYTEGIDLDPACLDTFTVATLYYNRSAVHRKNGDIQHALEDVNASLALRPRWAKALYRRGIVLLECGRSAEALTELKTVQRADPTFDEDLETWLRRAHHWLSKAQDEKDYYRFLRIPMDSSKDDIRRQYHRLCLLWHPDKNPTDEFRARFDELQEAYRFLMDDDLKDRYDFGIWKNKAVRHHAKYREKVSTLEAHARRVPQHNPLEVPAGFGDKHLEEDDKVEHICWGDRGAPEWMQTRRKEIARMRYGVAADD